jgi:phosphocarrier protein
VNTPDKAEPLTATREITINNELGLHARPAAAFVKCANRFRAEISLVIDGARYSATSLIEVLAANLDRGATATVEAHGPDAEEAVDALVTLVSQLRE